MIVTLQRRLLSISSALLSRSLAMAVAHSTATTISVRDKPHFNELFTDELKTLRDIFDKHGHELRIAGGVVRDLLMDMSPKDVDLATTATPSQMKEMFTAEGIRMLNMRGESHGTITARINDKENFEVTTLRIDTATDGRHAEVKFTTDWQLDANRRDLTVNSMFLGLDGTVYDYFGGIGDVAQRKVRFVGDPAQRICEDYLRILRYFRFYGRIAKLPDDHDQATLNAIRDNVVGLSGISGERIWVELRKILTGNHVGNLIPVALDLGLGPHIGLPDNPSVDTFKEVYKRSHNLEPQPMTLLASLLRSEQEMFQLHCRLKLSSDERDLGLFIVTHRENKPTSTDPAFSMKPYQLLVLRSAGGKRGGDQRRRQVERVAEVFKYRGESARLAQFLEWDPPRFPVDGHVLREHGLRNLKQFSTILDALLEDWVDSGYALTTQQLLDRLEPILDRLRSKR